MTDLRKIPGVGKKTKEDFIEMGITNVEALFGKDPEKLYEQHCKRKGYQVDRCQLYVFRAAIYYAEHPEVENRDKIKWWDFQDKK